MDVLQLVDRPGPAPEVSTRPDHLRSWWTAGLVASLVVVAVLTLTPEGAGWAWGSPVEELTWYLTGLDSTATMLQLVGNLALLAVPAAFAVLRRPALGRPAPLIRVWLAVGTGIELLQWALPLGRVVSPVDALLNATGAVAVGLVVTHLRWTSRPPSREHVVVPGGPRARHRVGPVGDRSRDHRCRRPGPCSPVRGGVGIGQREGRHDRGAQPGGRHRGRQVQQCALRRRRPGPDLGAVHHPALQPQLLGEAARRQPVAVRQCPAQLLVLIGCDIVPTQVYDHDGHDSPSSVDAGAPVASDGRQNGRDRLYALVRTRPRQAQRHKVIPR